MFIRMTYISFLPELLDEAVSIYSQEIVPVVKQQNGNEDIMLLEPTEASDQYISLTIWRSKVEAKQYESSGKYKELIDKVRHTFSQPPVLRSYTVKGTEK